MKILDLARTAPVLVWGPPGVGKSASIIAEAREAGLPVEVVIASIREPQDFTGLPVVSDGGVRFAPPRWAERLAEAGKGVLFLDEISTAPPAVQAALLRVVLDRVVGDLSLADGVLIVAAANPPDIAAGGWDLAPPLANRFIHIQFKLDPTEWVQNFPTYWGNPPQVGVDEVKWARARALVAGFIKARSHLLLQVPKDLEQAGLAWPSPRTWDFASRVLAMVGLDPTAAAEAVCGAVGEGAGLEFINWVREQDLPDPEELLSSPDKFRMPSRGDVAYAILSSVAIAAAGNLTPQRWQAAWKIIEIAAAEAADIAAVAAKTLAKARKGRADLPLPTGALEKLAPVLKEV